MKLLTTLYEHQKKAYEKLIGLRVGALYMEQGTGKTRTALEILAYRLKHKKISHVLWLCPFSVKGDLTREIRKHLGELPENFVICGIETLSASINENARLRQLTAQGAYNLIVDESNLIKNYSAIRTKNIIDIAMNCPYRMILTGTPISKNQVDLYAQWYVLDWRILGYRSYWSFSANHIQFDERIPGKIVQCLNVDYLIRKIAPYSYQIKKSQCLDLPPKTYSVKHYELSELQVEHYKQIADELLFQVEALHPYTIFRLFAALQNILSGFYVNVQAYPMEKRPFFRDPMENPRVRKLLQVIDGTGSEKIIIYCKYTHEINEVSAILNEIYGENSAIRFDGTISVKERNENLQQFLGGSRFLIANKRCAARGLNLQYCSYAIYYSNDWDYESRVQSEDRMHRMNQKGNVHIIDICAQYTLDERILDCLLEKKQLLEVFREQLQQVTDKREMGKWLLREVVDGENI